MTSDLGFAGYFHHASSGYDFALYRAYDSTHRRWLNRDPIGEAGGMNLYAYVNGNPATDTDPFGLWAWGDPLNQSVVNAVAGFGDGVSDVLTLGFYSTADIRDRLGIGGGIDQCTISYRGGSYSGYAWGIATLWASGLNGGGSSVFWSGYAGGARATAEGLGTTLEQTSIGRALDFLANRGGIPVPQWVWKAASATFASNAKGTAIAVVRSQRSTSVWNTIERPILQTRNIPIVIH